MSNRPSELRIALTQEQYCIIDPIDADLAQVKWCAAKIGTSRSFYVTRYDRSLTPHTRYIHREILERIIGRPLTKSDMCDHINQNPLDNRRCNIRLADRYENARNYSKCRPTKSSQYKGVFWRKSRSRWVAEIRKNGKLIIVGSFKDEENAARAYDAMAKELFGKFAHPNFP
jgi:hypothetical protein